MNLLKVLATVSGMTFISRVLGFVRDAIIARVFGAGLMTDAFFVAFKIPNLLRRLFAEGAFSQAFVPILAEYKNQRGRRRPARSIDHVSGVLALALPVVTRDRGHCGAAPDLSDRSRVFGHARKNSSSRSISCASRFRTSCSFRSRRWRRAS